MLKEKIKKLQDNFDEITQKELLDELEEMINEKDCNISNNEITSMKLQIETASFDKTIINMKKKANEYLKTLK